MRIIYSIILAVGISGCSCDEKISDNERKRYILCKLVSSGRLELDGCLFEPNDRVYFKKQPILSASDKLNSFINIWDENGLLVKKVVLTLDQLGGLEPLFDSGRTDLYGHYTLTLQVDEKKEFFNGYCEFQVSDSN